MAYTGNSIVDYLKSVGQDSSYQTRAKMAAEKGISNYTGTAQQNLELLSMLKSEYGSSPRPAIAEPTATQSNNVAQPSQFQSNQITTPESSTSSYSGYSSVNLPTPPQDMFVGRNLDKEYNALQKLNLNPMEIGTLDQLRLLEMTYTPQELANMPAYNYLKQSSEMREGLKQGITEGEAPSPAMLRPLEEALKSKIGMQNEPLGESELFQASGIDPYASLMTSLREKSLEMEDKYNSYAGMMGQVSDSLNSAWGNALKSYKMLRDEYETDIGRIDGYLKEIRNHEQALELIRAREESDKRLKEFAASLDEKNAGGKWVENPQLATGGKFTNLVTGSGTITARGSSLWKYGLDVSGPKDSAIMSPIEGTVIGIGENGGFGNQIKIRKEDGTEIWLSHLNAFNPDLFMGAEVKRGDTVGTLGNTGNVIDLGGGGYHVDITMKKPDGAYLTPEQVESYIATQDLDFPASMAQTAFENIKYGEESEINKLLGNTKLLGQIKAAYDEGSNATERQAALKKGLDAVEVPITKANLLKLEDAISRL